MISSLSPFVRRYRLTGQDQSDSDIPAKIIQFVISYLHLLQHTLRYPSDALSVLGTPDCHMYLQLLHKQTMVPLVYQCCMTDASCIQISIPWFQRIPIWHQCQCQTLAFPVVICDLCQTCPFLARIMELSTDVMDASTSCSVTNLFLMV
jgi:hypothetical protein